ncbi:MAG: SAM-dependent methyltransferase [Saprospiraceae bacterium]
MEKLDAEYWDSRYCEDNTPWDIGYASPAILDYFKNVDKESQILIPGAGYAHEAIELFKMGFKNVVVCDWAEHAIEKFANAHPEFPKNQLITGDFFELDGLYDYMIEQTFFCALPPPMRKEYVKKSHQLLKPNGILTGLLFATEFEKEGPPFGGTKTEYLSLFQSDFQILHMEISEKSIPPRMGNEFFVEIKKG